MPVPCSLSPPTCNRCSPCCKVDRTSIRSPALRPSSRRCKRPSSRRTFGRLSVMHPHWRLSWRCWDTPSPLVRRLTAQPSHVTPSIPRDAHRDDDHTVASSARRCALGRSREPQITTLALTCSYGCRCASLACPHWWRLLCLPHCWSHPATIARTHFCVHACSHAIALTADTLQWLQVAPTTTCSCGIFGISASTA